MSQPVGQDPAAGPPVCPRHPGRESYVRCQRCGRPACAQCQMVAPVGIQCVDCVREGARTMRQSRTAAGALARGGPPRITYGFIGLCVLVYLGQLASDDLTFQLAFNQAWAEVQPWRYLTNALVHAVGGMPLHILFNMYAMYLLGPPLEQLFGRVRYSVLLILSALGGSVGFQLLAASTGWMVGASGVVFGLFGAFLTAGSKIGVRMSGIVVLIAINFVFGFVVPNIAWQGHLGGFLAGAACGGVLVRAPAKSRVLVQSLGLGLIAVALVALAVLA
ncbi:MAG: rhomboid family intramembrane serine protease [Micrococcales bacterium]|nr:MAG: rhomboid family intramembrane serine protease [Micrococcales bacterium]